MARVDRVGEPDGALVLGLDVGGVSVGLDVGTSVGASVGAGTGAAVGRAVGSGIGTVEGAGVGTPVGSALGAGDGANVSTVTLSTLMLSMDASPWSWACVIIEDASAPDETAAVIAVVTTAVAS